MPKSLSLKKVNNTKPQKPITDFFKANDCTKTTEDTKPNKRKTTEDEPQKNNIQSSDPKIEKSKRQKLQSPVKENGYMTPTKKNKLDKSNSLSPVNSLKNGNTQINSDCVIKMHSPLKTITNLSPKVKESNEEDNLKCFEEDDLFGDDNWDLCDEQNNIEDLDLSVSQRCEIMSVNINGCAIELKLRNGNNKSATCLLEGAWFDPDIKPGETVTIQASLNNAGVYTVNNTSGFLILRPDHLMSTTSVVAGVFCKRKAVLQERFKGVDSASSVMTIGILVHELVQKALTNNISDITKLQNTVESIVKESTIMLYDCGMTVDEVVSTMGLYLQPLSDFMKLYVGDKKVNKVFSKDMWAGHIDKVLDIEENVYCPQLGLKGKIDASLEVTIHQKTGPKRAIVPLELKSGRATVSSEHRGQLILYCMMLDMLKRDLNETYDTSLLLYLKERVELREVSAGHPERRDLLLLRNQLVQYLAAPPIEIDPDQITDIEDISKAYHQRLPDPINHENACTKCPYLTLCSLHLWYTPGPIVNERHPLRKLRSQAISHLSEEHIKYFLHWQGLLKMEEKVQMKSAPLHALWTEDVNKRTKRGVCLANLTLKSVTALHDKYLHTFSRSDWNTEINQKSGPIEGDFSIVSVDNRPWIAAGVISEIKDGGVKILLERDLSKRWPVDMLYHLDTYESYASTVQNLTNLGVLMEDTENSERLRRIIIDKTEGDFEQKLSRDVGRLGTKLMKSLNIQQQRAVLKAIASKDYCLLQGLPGTGKTQTVSVMIQMMVALKQRVLVTAHTHSAVDTVLNRLPSNIRVMRLGTSSRVSNKLQSRCERHLTDKCQTPEELAEVYESMEVISVTCLGSTHALLSRATFDVCIVDEATQVLQSTVLRPLLSANKFVLVGDPEQLPPVVRSRGARKWGMEESLFHRLNLPKVTSTLQLQYRMNERLSSLANIVAYEGNLKCANESVATALVDVDFELLKTLTTEPWLLTACSPKAEHAALFIDLDKNTLDQNEKTVNKEETCVVIAVVKTFVEAKLPSTSIGVIAPYRDQVSLIRRSLLKANLDVEVSTVDQFQGRDKSVILYSCTRSDCDKDKVKEGEVLNDKRRLAVSVTRAKHKLIVLGHLNAIKKYDTLMKIAEECPRISIDDKQIVVNRYKGYIA